MMTTKERLVCGVGLLNSIDARRKHSDNPQAFLAVEQAIVDREIFARSRLFWTYRTHLEREEQGLEFLPGQLRREITGVAEAERPSHRSLLKRKLP